MTYIIHGATGAQGAPVLTQLLAAGKHAVAVVRHPDAHTGTAAIRVDNTSVQSLTEAYRGAEGVFIHLPVAPEEARLAQANAIVAAIAAARPTRVVISTSGSIVDAPGNALQAPASAAITVLIEGVQATGVSTAIVAPRLFLENLLLPMVIGGARAEGVLGYPIREDFAVSWGSHLDVAEVVVRLFEMPELRGVVGVGHLPGLLGRDLAAGMAEQLQRTVAFRGVLPADFGKLLEPMLGPAAAAVTGLYQALWQAPANTIDPASSAQHLLGLTPRSVAQWLRDVSASAATPS